MIKKIETKQSKDKKKKRNKYLLSALLILIMFGSSFGAVMVFNSNDDSSKSYYRGYALEEQNENYKLVVGERTFYFSVNPNDASKFNNIDMNVSVLSFMGAPLYIDFVDYFSFNEIYQNVEGYPTRIQSACLVENDCYDSKSPIKSCEDNMIIIRESDKNRVYQEENCIFIEGTNKDLPSVIDAFLLKLFGLN